MKSIIFNRYCALFAGGGAGTAPEALRLVDFKGLLYFSLRSFCKALSCTQRTADTFFFIDRNLFNALVVGSRSDCGVGAYIFTLTAAMALFRIYFVAGFILIRHRNIEKAGESARSAARTLIFINIKRHILTSRCRGHYPDFFSGFQHSAFF